LQKADPVVLVGFFVVCLSSAEKGLGWGKIAGRFLSASLGFALRKTLIFVLRDVAGRETVYA